jgi:hypothetical protein
VSGFAGPLDVQILDVGRGGRVTAKLLSAFSYDVGGKGSGETLTVPAGYLTDFASVPQPFWNIEPPLGDAGKAAVVHDALYSTAGTMLIGGFCGRTRKKPYARAEADGIFDEALAVLAVPAWKRALLWAAVRVGGAGGWGR